MSLDYGGTKKKKNSSRRRKSDTSNSSSRKQGPSADSVSASAATSRSTRLDSLMQDDDDIVSKSVNALTPNPISQVVPISASGVVPISGHGGIPMSESRDMSTMGKSSSSNDIQMNNSSDSPNDETVIQWNDTIWDTSDRPKENNGSEESSEEPYCVSSILELPIESRTLSVGDFIRLQNPHEEFEAAKNMKPAKIVGFRNDESSDDRLVLDSNERTFCKKSDGMFDDFFSTKISKVVRIEQDGKKVWKALTEWFALGDFILDDKSRGVDTATSLREQGAATSATIDGAIEYHSNNFWDNCRKGTK